MSYYTLLETKTQAIALHQYIKDKKYLVGNQLQNASDEPESNEAQQQEQEQQQEAVWGDCNCRGGVTEGWIGFLVLDATWRFDEGTGATEADIAGFIFVLVVRFRWVENF